MRRWHLEQRGERHPQVTAERMEKGIQHICGQNTRILEIQHIQGQNVKREARALTASLDVSLNCLSVIGVLQV